MTHIKTDLDDIDPKSLKGQHSRTHRWQKKILVSAGNNLGLIDTSCVPNFIAPVRDVAQVEFLTSKAPLDKMRFSRKATDYTRLLLENVYRAKIQDLQTLNSLTGKQTMSMSLVWTERRYRSTMDLKATDVVNQSGIDVETSMLEDLRASTAHWSESTLTPDAWCNFVKLHGELHMHEGNNIESLQSVADKTFGCSGVWSAPSL